MEEITRKGKLRERMMARAPESSLVHVSRALFSRYLDIADAGEWTLEDRSSLDAAEMAKQMTRLLGVPVNDIRFVSLSNPYDDLEWTTIEAFARIAETDVGSLIADSVENAYEHTYVGRLYGLQWRLLAALGERRREIVDGDVAKAIMPGLRSAMFATVVDRLGIAMTDSLVHAVEDTLVFAYGYAVIDDRFAGVPLGHAARILTQTLPLGEKRDEPGTWLFLTN
jgi:hypothetical protein